MEHIFFFFFRAQNIFFGVNTLIHDSFQRIISPCFDYMIPSICRLLVLFVVRAFRNEGPISNISAEPVKGLCLAAGISRKYMPCRRRRIVNSAAVCVLYDGGQDPGTTIALCFAIHIQHSTSTHENYEWGSA